MGPVDRLGIPLRLVSLGLLLVNTVSCGADQITTEAVAGRVTLDGQPVTAGVVHFVPSAGPAASGVIGADGTFELTTRVLGDGAVPGRHRVFLSPPAAPVVELSPEEYADGKLPAPVEVPIPFPQKYLSANTSDLTVEVSSARNQVAIELNKLRE